MFEQMDKTHKAEIEELESYRTALKAREDYEFCFSEFDFGEFCVTPVSVSIQHCCSHLGSNGKIGPAKGTRRYSRIGKLRTHFSLSLVC